ncbi:hypothetical protein P1P68_14660 [Streptomyces scabiei]|uniref:hypothetical protein n=1 Tax=Streptomyces scabiei TaxID=1930 RepID=UPI00298F5CD2|nr:hypothetical protein [Streptomyces scabiei]MDW8805989.1 hypothetical protein [Streptomyces scabiei]
MARYRSGACEASERRTVSSGSRLSAYFRKAGLRLRTARCASASLLAGTPETAAVVPQPHGTERIAAELAEARTEVARRLLRDALDDCPPSLPLRPGTEALSGRLPRGWSTACVRGC